MTDASRTIDDELETPRKGDTRLRQAMEMVPAALSRGDVLAHDLTRAQVLAKDHLIMPPHLHDQPGTILNVLELSRHWGMLPMMVARQTYVPKAGQFAFMSQLLHAVIEQNAPITQRIRRQFGRIVQEKQPNGATIGVFIEDMGAPPEERRCRVWTYVKGEVEPIEYISPPFTKITPKNSPLWVSDPDQQLFYRSVTMFGRTYFPDILMGCYTPEELSGNLQFTDTAVEDPRKAVLERLKAQQDGEGPREGMQAGDPAAAMGEPPEDTPEKPAPKPQAASKAKAATSAPPKGGKRPPGRPPAAAKASKPEPEPEQEHLEPEEQAEIDAAAKAEEEAEAANEAQEAAGAQEDELAPPKGRKPVAEKPQPPAKPTNAAQYRAWVEHWVGASVAEVEGKPQHIKDAMDEAIRKRWGNEMALRNQCNMVSAERDLIAKEVVAPALDAIAPPDEDLEG